MRACKKLDMVSFASCYGEKGLTHIQLLEYFFIFFMIVSIMAIITLEVPVVYANLWAKIDASLFR